MVEWIAAQPAVEWVEARQGLHLHNWQASAIVQSGAAAPGDAESLSRAAIQELLPMARAGLRGEGQVLGMGDSGIGAIPSLTVPK